MMDAQSEVKEFFEGFQLYQQIIENNYMVHQEILQWMLPRFQQLTADIKVLELGCGDAYLVGKIAQSHAIGHYVGIDLSDPALEFAKKNLSGKIESIQLIAGDMLEAVQKIDEKFDLVLASYSVHHLSWSQKQKLMHFIYECLSPSGTLYLIDTFKNQEESREAYLKRASNCFLTEWKNLTSEQLDSINNHVQSYDFPESFDRYQYLGSQVGMKTISAEYLDAEHLFGVMELQKR